jgi:hypothetical protein
MTFIIQPSSTWTGQFPVLDDTGALVDADALPTGTLVLDAVDDAAVVTIALVASPGLYSYSVTTPAGASVGAHAQLRANATIDGIATAGIVAEGQIDTVYPSQISAALTVLSNSLRGSRCVQ